MNDLKRTLSAQKSRTIRKECVEINVRPHCFYPACEHVDYITLNGFVVTKAATNWAPPTALQDGMIGPHWSKGWLIDNCEVSHSKCSGISLGKYFQQHNDNKWSRYKYKDGAQTQRDCSLIAQLDGDDRISYDPGMRYPRLRPDRDRGQSVP